jgi:hypothetical protein
VDSLLLSLHLEGDARRDAFRAARQRVQEASAGQHTMAGEICLLSPDHPLDRTLSPEEVPVSTTRDTFCWLLDRGQQIPLKVGLNRIGRFTDNDIVINNATVSRRHCAIVVHSNLVCEIHDVASKNGTIVNGTKIDRPSRLQDGDIISLSEHRLTFVKPEAESTSKGEG